MPEGFQIISQKDFRRGLYASSNRFSHPQGIVRRISNLAYKTRGALQTIDGTLIVSSLNGAGATTGQPMFVWVGAFNQDGVASKLLAIQYNVAGNNVLQDVTGASWSGAGTIIGTAFQTPAAVQFGNLLFITSGLGVGASPLKTWNGTVIADAGNTWNVIANVPLWQTQISIQINDVTRPSVDNGHVYVAIQAGLTGTSQPSFPTGAGAQVVDGTVVWQETGPSALGATTHAPACDTIISHEGFLWAWGTKDTNAGSVAVDSASTLRMSDLNNGGSWNPLNSTYLGKSDGQVARGAAVFALSEAGIAPTPNLVCFKDFSAYQISGVFPQVQIQQAQSDLGCVASRSVQFVAALGGVVRLTHKGFALFRGVGAGADQVISDNIREYIFSSTELSGIDFSNATLCMSSQSFNPPQYICAVYMPASGLVRAFILDLELKAWSVVDFPFQLGTTAYSALAGSTPTTYLAGAADGTIRRWWAGEGDWDGTSIAWSVTGDQVQSGATSQPFSVSRVNIRTRNASVSGTTVGQLSTAKLVYDPVQGGNEASVALVAGTTLPTSIGIHSTVQNAALQLTGTGPVMIEAFDWSVKAKPFRRIGVAA